MLIERILSGFKREQFFRPLSLLALIVSLSLLLAACATPGLEPEAQETLPSTGGTQPPTEEVTQPPVTPEPSETQDQPPVTEVPSPTGDVPPLVTPTTMPEAGGADPDHPAVQAAIQALSNTLQADPSTITVVEVTPMEWTDSCLGLGGPQEMCLQVITPGYLVVLSVDGVEYQFRTDQSGDIIRQGSGIGSARNKLLGP